MIRPPVRRENELSTSGFMFLPFFEIRTLLVAVEILAIKIIITPAISPGMPKWNSMRPALTSTIPARPRIMVIIFARVNRSSLIIIRDTIAVTKGCDPTITAPRAPGTRSMPR